MGQCEANRKKLASNRKQIESMQPQLAMLSTVDPQLAFKAAVEGSHMTA
eukprot:NODE_7204_length_266_cov_172.276498_g6591_i0.p1 GENE.NODE_7204_length_266_cov_172.276498_g6591_i0~~NODE_7204_length_266_cov_172.276498_g6591_i0.p1  ORF type:complete len:59 (+),score=25.60 NODE_7204_length_266_cov_172.276498_g6591_i0:31-177(+)